MICVNKKIAIGVSFLLVLFFFFLAVSSIMPGKKSVKQTSSSSSTESAKIALNRMMSGGAQTAARLNNDQIATLLLQWANNTRTEKGGYASGEDCDGEGTCAPLVVNNGVGAPAIWARYRFYLKHKNVDAIDIVRQDIKTYVDSGKVITIQPYFWNCKLLYELWQSPHLSQDEKYGLQTICARSIYNAIDLVPKDASPTAEAVIAQVNDDLTGKGGREETYFIGPPDTKNLDEYAFNASDRAMIYAWGKDPSDLQQARLYFIAAMQALHNTTDTGLAADEAPMVGIAALDMNAVVPAPELKTYAEAVYTRYKDTSCSAVQKCVMRAYFYNELYKLDKKTEYKTQRDIILNKLYTKQFDYQGTDGYFAGKQAFYDHGLNYSYDLIPNTMLAGLLLDL